jgi:hypothetical protein
MVKKSLDKVAKLGRHANEWTRSNIAGSVGAGVGAEWADQEVPHLNDQGMASLVGGILGGYGARTGASLARTKKSDLLKGPKDTAAKVIGTSLDFSPKKYQELKNLDIPARLSSVSNHKKNTRRLETMLEKVPFSEDIKNHRLAEARAIAKHLGVSDLEKAPVKDALAKKGAKGFYDRKARAYEKLEKVFKPREQLAMENHENIPMDDVIQELRKKRHQHSPALREDLFDSSPRGKLLETLEKNKSQNGQDCAFPQHILEKNPELAELLKKERGEGINLHDLNRLREEALTQAEKHRGPLGKSTPQSREADELHYLLSKKRHDWMDAVGTPREKKAAKQARKLWHQFKGEENLAHYVSQITGAADDTTAFKMLGKSPSYFRVVRQGLPGSERKDLATNFVTHLGQDPHGFNIQKFHKNYKQLSPDIQEELRKCFPHKDAKNFENVMTYLSENPHVIKNILTSSDISQEMKMIKKIGGASGLYGVHSPLGGSSALGMLGIWAAAKGASKLWTHPKFLERMNRLLKAETMTEKEKALRLVTKSIRAAQHSREDSRTQRNGPSL